MKRQDAVSRIRQAEPAIRALGVRGLYLFGSTAREEATPASDVDVFVDRAAGTLGLIEFFDLQAVLEATLGTKVDLTTREALHPILKPDIERSAIRVL